MCSTTRSKIAQPVLRVVLPILFCRTGRSTHRVWRLPFAQKLGDGGRPGRPMGDGGRRVGDRFCRLPPVSQFLDWFFLRKRWETVGDGRLPPSPTILWWLFSGRRRGTDFSSFLGVKTMILLDADYPSTFACQFRKESWSLKGLLCENLCPALFRPPGTPIFNVLVPSLFWLEI